jgi:hypothetical protein
VVNRFAVNMQILFSYMAHVKGGVVVGAGEKQSTVVVGHRDGYNENVICERGFWL